MQGKLVVITGPSGVGKGTLLSRLLADHPEYHLSISATTRTPRPGEIDGQSYYFVTDYQFKQMIQQQKLLEYAEYAGHYYGTPRQPVEAQIQQGKLVILEIELLGARQVRQTYPQALQVFIQPPSLAELERRIRDRAHNSEADMAQRLEQARAEIAAAPEFDVQIMNDDLEQALRELQGVLGGLES